MNLSYLVFKKIIKKNLFLIFVHFSFWYRGFVSFNNSFLSLIIESGKINVKFSEKILSSKNQKKSTSTLTCLINRSKLLYKRIKNVSLLLEKQINRPRARKNELFLANTFLSIIFCWSNNRACINNRTLRSYFFIYLFEYLIFMQVQLLLP